MSQRLEHGPEVSGTEALFEDIQKQVSRNLAELEQACQSAEQYRTRCDELTAQLEQWQRKHHELQLRLMDAEKAARELQQNGDRLRVQAAHAESTVSNLNRSLTYCQNRTWELMLQLREYIKSPGHRFGHHYEYLHRNWGRTFINSLHWIWNHLLGRPFVLAKSLGATYAMHELQGQLESLAYYARDATRRISDLPLMTPTSMAKRTFHTAHTEQRARPDLIVYSITNWTFRRQRPQHLVGGLVEKGCRAFVMPTDTIGLGEEFPTDSQILERMVIRHLEEDIWEVQPCSFHALNIYRDSLQDPRDLALLGRSLALLRKERGIGRHLGLVQLPFWGPLAAALPGARILYDCMDNHSDFSTNAAGMLEEEDRLLREADAVIVSSEYLDRMVGDKPRAKTLIRNACQYDYFATPPPALDPLVAELPGPVIGYYGAISDWFDVALVEDLARRRPDWRFVLIGHTFGAQLEGLKTLSNVLFVGEVPYERLTSFLYRFDVCMIPFLLTDLILATNPVKIYEYAAAGKPTVATRIPEVARLGDLAAVADDAAGFEAAIERCLNEPDQPARAARLREFARANTWKERIKDLERVIRDRAYPRVSIIVLSYNNWPVTSDCLQSILNETLYPNFELIVIDNGSDAVTREHLQALAATKDPRLKVRMSETNLGYAGGNNLGCRMAEGDYLILLNNDTICPSEWIDQILAAFEEDPRVGMAGPMTNSAGNEQMLDSLCLNRQNQREWLMEFYRARRGLRHETDRLGFFCVAMRREAFEQIGELDDEFQIGYFEDDDYCKRALEKGWKLVVVEDAYVHHLGSVSFKKLDPAERQAIEEKNRARFERKHGCAWRAPICEYMHFARGGPGHDDRPRVVIGPAVDWLADPAGRPQQMALALAELGCRVYYVTDNRKQDQYLGVRLLRPNLYLVENREEWIREIAAERVDLAIDFGPQAGAALAQLNAQTLMVDLSAADPRTPWQWEAHDPRFAPAVEKAAWISVTDAALTHQIPSPLLPRVLAIPQGVDVRHFQRGKPLAPPPALAKVIADHGGPIIACLGRAGAEHDWNWLEGLARSRRAWPIVFLDADGAAGPAELPEFFNLRNVHHLREGSFVDLPDYLAYTQVGLLAPPATPDEEGCCGSLLYPFAAAGVPVVASRLSKDERLNTICIQAPCPEEAAAAIERCRLRSLDGDFRRQCRETVQAYDWKHLLAPLRERLAERF